MRHFDLREPAARHRRLLVCRSAVVSRAGSGGEVGVAGSLEGGSQLGALQSQLCTEAAPLWLYSSHEGVLPGGGRFEGQEVLLLWKRCQYIGG